MNESPNFELNKSIFSKRGYPGLLSQSLTLKGVKLNVDIDNYQQIKEIGIREPIAKCKDKEIKNIFLIKFV